MYRYRKYREEKIRQLCEHLSETGKDIKDISIYEIMAILDVSYPTAKRIKLQIEMKPEICEEVKQ